MRSWILKVNVKGGLGFRYAISWLAVPRDVLEPRLPHNGLSAVFHAFFLPVGATQGLHSGS